LFRDAGSEPQLVVGIERDLHAGRDQSRQWMAGEIGNDAQGDIRHRANVAHDPLGGQPAQECRGSRGVDSVSDPIRAEVVQGVDHARRTARLTGVADHRQPGEAGQPGRFDA
jgi:hypothetical protein